MWLKAAFDHCLMRGSSLCRVFLVFLGSSYMIRSLLLGKPLTPELKQRYPVNPGSSLRTITVPLGAIHTPDQLRQVCAVTGTTNLSDEDIKSLYLLYGCV